MTGLLLLCAAVTLTVVVGAMHRSRDGRLRDPTGPPGPTGLIAAGRVPSPARPRRSAARSDTLQQVLDDLGRPPGAQATLLQFSSAFCAPCRATRRILTEVSAMVDGVAHIEVDAEQHLDLVRRLRILKTPTTLVLDAHLREVKRATGQPRKADVLAALGQALP